MSIENTMLSVLYEMFGIQLTKEQYELNFFGKELGLKARNVVDFIFEIEKRLEIDIIKTCILNKNICAFSELLNVCMNF